MQGLILQMLEGTIVSLKVFFLTLLFSLPLGFVVAKGKMTRIKPIRWLTDFYIQIMRGTPLILQLIFFYFAPFYLFGVSYDRFTACIVAFVVNYSAYFAEIYRSGLQSIDRGQHEAAKLYILRHNPATGNKENTASSWQRGNNACKGYSPGPDNRSRGAFPCGSDRLIQRILNRPYLCRGCILFHHELHRLKTFHAC